MSRRGRIDEGKTLMTEARRVADAQTAAKLTTEWDAALYFKFGAERAQPAHDLLARVDFTPRRIVDLGCGPGASTRMLLERFPQAEIRRRLQFRADARRGAPQPARHEFRADGHRRMAAASAALTSSSPTRRCNGCAITRPCSRA